MLFSDQVDRLSVLNPLEAWWQKETHINGGNRFQHKNAFHQVNVRHCTCFTFVFICGSSKVDVLLQKNDESSDEMMKKG